MTDKPYPYNKDQLAWLHDLETTEEPQGKGYLHSDDGFSCLGRACVVFGLKANQPIYSDCCLYDGESCYLPHYLGKRLRLRGGAGRIFSIDESGDKVVSDSLAKMNDKGKPFKEIAAFIRANPWDVFLAPGDVFLDPGDES